MTYTVLATAFTYLLAAVICVPIAKRIGLGAVHECGAQGALARAGRRRQDQRTTAALKDCGAHDQVLMAMARHAPVETTFERCKAQIAGQWGKRFSTVEPKHCLMVEPTTHSERAIDADMEVGKFLA